MLDLLPFPSVGSLGPSSSLRVISCAPLPYLTPHGLLDCRYPKGYDEGDNGGWMITHAPDYVLNSLELGSFEWNNLIRAIKKEKIYVALGFSERYEDRIYMGQALISPEGEKLMCVRLALIRLCFRGLLTDCLALSLSSHRHKLRPSGSERDLWSDGLIKTLQVVDTPYGRWGMLECWEYVRTSFSLLFALYPEPLSLASAGTSIPP